MADVYSLGDIAARGATMLEIRWARLLAEHGPSKSFSEVMRGLVGDCPNKDSHQIQTAVILTART
jgi:hypothetical protein